MPCELFDCCQFFNDNMKNLPISADYIRNRVCLADYHSCTRYRIYREYRGEDIPPYLNASDVEEVQKATLCLQQKVVARE